MSFFYKKYVHHQHHQSRHYQMNTPPALHCTFKIIQEPVQMQSLAKDRVLKEKDDCTKYQACNSCSDSPDSMPDQRNCCEPAGQEADCNSDDHSRGNESQGGHYASWNSSQGLAHIGGSIYDYRAWSHLGYSHNIGKLLYCTPSPA